MSAEMSGAFRAYATRRPRRSWRVHESRWLSHVAQSVAPAKHGHGATDDRDRAADDGEHDARGAWTIRGSLGGAGGARVGDDGVVDREHREADATTDEA